METVKNLTYRRWLTIILALYMLLAVVNIVSTPLLRGPDEPAHVIYVKSLAFGGFPTLSSEETRDIDDSLSHEAHQPPLYYILAAIPFRVVYELTVDTESAIYGARGMSLLLGLVWIYLVSRMACDFFGKGKKALYATAFVACIPMSTYIAGVVNNDVMVCLTFTWALWLMTGAIKRGVLTRKTAVWLGIATGLAILSKAQGLLLIPLILLTAYLNRSRKSQASSTYASGALLSLAAAALVSFWWLVRNIFVYGQPIPQSIINPIATPALLMSDPVSAVRLALVITWPLFRYFWMPFWVVDRYESVNPGLYVALRAVYLSVFGAFTLIGIVGAITAAISSRRKKTSVPTTTGVYILFIAAALLVHVSVLYQIILVDRGVFSQGRLLLPLAPALAIILVRGYLVFIKNKRLRGFVAIAGITALVALNLLSSYAVYYNYEHVETSEISRPLPRAEPLG